VIALRRLHIGLRLTRRPDKSVHAARLAVCCALALMVCASLSSRAFAQAAGAEPGPDASSSIAENPPAQSQATDNAAGPAAPPLLLRGSIDVSEGYTTNAGGGTVPPYNGHDTYTRGSLNFGAHYVAPHLTADASYSLSADYYSRLHALNELQNQLMLIADGEIAQKILFIDARAFATPTYLSRVGALSAGGQPVSNSNSRNTYGYSVRPDYIQRIGDFATSDFSVSQQGVFFLLPHTSSSGPPAPNAANNSLVTTASEKITSGSDFSRLQWSADGSYTEMTQSTQSEKQSEGIGTISYAVARWLTVLGQGGYDKFISSVPLTKDLSGPVAIGGVQVTYGPTLELLAEAGVQHNFPTYQGSLRWIISPLDSILASATDAIQTPQGGILGNLGNIAASPSGAFYDSQTGLPDSGLQSSSAGSTPLSPTSPDGLALDNSINRERQFILSATHTEERTSISLGLFGTIRDRLDITIVPTAGPRTSEYGVRASVGRKLRIDLSAEGDVSYSLADEFGGHDHILTAGAGLNYTYSEHTEAFLRAQYLQRESNGIIGFGNAPLSSAEIVIGVRYRL